MDRNNSSESPNPSSDRSILSILKTFSWSDFQPKNAATIPGLVPALLAGSLAGGSMMGLRFATLRLKNQAGRKAFASAGNYGMGMFLIVSTVTFEYLSYQQRVVRTQLLQLSNQDNKD